jgi:two-component system phosphate regulon sensor histidine kinase PhoR
MLFDMSALDPLGQTVFWSMLFNIGFYVLGSLFFGMSEREQGLAEEFVSILDRSEAVPRGWHGEAYIPLAPKREEIENLLGLYYGKNDAASIVTKCIEEVGIKEASQISSIQLVELHNAVEKSLAGAIGTAAAYRALRQGVVLSAREAKDLSEVYAQVLADLKLTPSELKNKIDYHKEKEQLLMRQAKELEEKVEALKAEIAQRRRFQEALRQSEVRFRGLVETMNEGLEIEDEQGIVTYVNRKLCDMLDCDPDAIIGRPAARFLGEAQWNRLKEQMQNRKESEMESYEVSWTSSDGSTVWAIMSPVSIFDSMGEYKGRFAVFIDISHLKGLEREKANLISMFAHDMRSSLAGIHGLALRLLNKSDSMDEEKKGEHLRIINREASKLESLVDDFLEFSRLETGRLKLNFRSVSLDKELLELAEAYEIRARQKDLQLVVRIEEPLPIIQADVNRLRRVFTNLLDNALKFSGECGKITIAAYEREQDVLVHVSDEGIGIAPEELPYIFDLFHRGSGSEKREGYGIGLATVKAIVEGHGGRVHVSSEVGKGTKFTVYLPRQQKEK